MHVRPKSYPELFDFLKYCKVKNVLKDMAIAAATAKAGTENG
jgi:hypothetical protein